MPTPDPYMMPLTTRKCGPCHSGGLPLPADQVATLLTQITGWDVVDGKALRKTLKLADFMSVVRAIQRIAEIAEAEDHHPDLHLTNYRQLVIEISTHAVGGLTDNDFILAAKLDQLSLA